MTTQFCISVGIPWLLFVVFRGILWHTICDILWARAEQRTTNRATGPDNRQRMGQMRYIVTNGFHATEVEIMIRDGEKYEAIGDRDVMIGLESSAFSDCDAYAIRKLREIKDKVCGSRECKCGGATVASRA